MFPMRAARWLIAAIMTLLVTALIGCRGPQGGTPSLLATATGAQPPDTTADAADSTVAQAGFEEPSSDSYHEPVKDGVDKDLEVKEDRFLGIPPPKETYEKFLTLIGLGPDRQLAEKYFQEAEVQFRLGNYDDAAKKYKRSARRWPDSSLEEDALFRLGESYFFSDKYARADDTYSNLLTKFDNSRYLDKVVAREFAIGRYWDELHQVKPRWLLVPNLTDRTRPRFDTMGNALKAYETVHLNDPTGPLADDAVLATANAHFLNKKYEDADYYYGLVRTEYPKSEHQEIAHVLGLQSKMRSYQGAHYDGTPLKSAEELAEQMQRNFPGQSIEDRAQLDKNQAIVRAQQAERDLKMAEFYEKTKHYGSARIYYDLVVKGYPDTPIADLAQVRIKEIEGLPDVPKQKMEWLVNLLDRKKRR